MVFGDWKEISGVALINPFTIHHSPSQPSRITNKKPAPEGTGSSNAVKHNM
jgi:hypothetical protein